MNMVAPLNDLPPLLGERQRLVRGFDSNPYLAAADLLISDASSVANEFLVLDRPLVFFRLSGLEEDKSTHLAPRGLPGRQRPPQTWRKRRRARRAGPPACLRCADPSAENQNRAVCGGRRSPARGATRGLAAGA